MSTTTEERKIKIIADGKSVQATFRQMIATQRILRSQWSKMKRDDPGFKKKTKELSEMNAKVSDARKEVSAFKKSSNGWMSTFKQGMLAVSAGNLLNSALGMIKNLTIGVVMYHAEMSDVQADVMKNTNMTAKSLDSLQGSLGKISTRTSRKELLKLASVAGKLGIKGVDNITNFVKSANMIDVALGEDLGAGAIKQIGKINELFGEVEKHGLDVAMLKTGSAINSLGQDSTASEPYLVQFTKELGGIAKTANISTANVLGLASASDQLGLNVETTTTTIGRVMVDMATKVDVYAKVAGKSISDFGKIVKNDANYAFLLFLKGLKSGKADMSQVAKRMESLNLEGARSKKVLLSLANGTGLIRKAQYLSNEEFKRGTSILKEYNIKNNNFAANLEKVKKKFKGWIMNNSFTKGLVRLVGNIASAASETENYTNALIKQRSTFNVYISMLKEGNLSLVERKKIIGILNKEYGGYMDNLLTEKSTLAEIETAQKKVNDAMMDKLRLQMKEKFASKLLEKELELRESAFNAKFKLQEIKDRENDPEKRLKYSAELAARGLDQNQIALLKGLDANNKAKYKLIIEESLKQAEELKLENERRNTRFDELYKAKTNINPKKNLYDGSGFPTSPKGNKKKMTIYDKKLYALKLWHAKAKVEIGKNLKDNEITYETYVASVEGLDRALQVQKIELLKKYGKDKKVLLDEQSKLVESDAKSEIKVHKSVHDAQKQMSDAVKKQEAKDRKEKEKNGKKDSKKEIERAQEVMDAKLQIYHESIRLLETIMNNYNNRELQNLENSKNHELKMAGNSATKREAIETNYSNQKAELLKKQAMQAKALAVFEIAIDTARGIVKASATGNIGLAVAMGVIGAIQAGIVAAEPLPQFYEGGWTPRGDSKEVGGIVHKNEFVIPEFIASSPSMANTMQALDAMVINKSVTAVPNFSTKNSNIQSNDANKLYPILLENAKALKLFNEIMSKPIVAKTFYNKDEYDDFQKRADTITDLNKFAS